MTKALTREEKKVLESAKESFQKMQKTWWEFAKIMNEIKQTEAYKAAGYETFKEYCEEEFATMNYSSIVKFVLVAETMGKTIESKIEKDKDYVLPAYEACYTVATMKEGSMTKEEIARLKRDVLERKLSFHKLRDRIKDMLESRRAEIIKDEIKSKEEIDKLEKKLEEEIDSDTEVEFSDELGEDVDFDSDLSDDLVESDYESVIEECMAKALKCSSDLYDNLEVLEENIENIDYDKKVEKFALKMEKTYNKMESVLKSIEEM